MSEEDGFIQAILGDPDDDTPRLVFADWLEKRGEPRAEFIRVQCALSKLTADRERAAFMSLGQKQFAADEGASIRLVRAWLLTCCYGIQHALVDCPAVKWPGSGLSRADIPRPSARASPRDHPGEDTTPDRRIQEDGGRVSPPGCCPSSTIPRFTGFCCGHPTASAICSPQQPNPGLRAADFTESDLPAVKPEAKRKHAPTAHWAAFTFSGVRPAK